MAKQGNGGLAVSIATFASVTGGIVGAVCLLLLAPPLAKVALNFGPPEYFWLAILGLTLISALSVGNTMKGLIGACVGLLMSMVGVAVVGGDVRFTMGTQALLGGFDITAAIIGLYCVPVLIDLVSNRNPHLKVSEEGQGLRLLEALRISYREKFNLFRSSVIGTVIGILPGAGGSIARLVAYSEARRSSKESEKYGSGHPGGIIATESANNATVGGGFIPTLVLGIPGTPPDAIILGALLVQGIKVGPALFEGQAPIACTFIFGLLIATILMLPTGLLIGRYAYKSISFTPKTLLVPTISFLIVVGSYSIHSDVADIQMMLILGVLAWILERFGFSASPIVLGLVLGKIAEQGFVQSYLIGNSQQNVLGMFLGRPISILIIFAALLTLLYPLIARFISRRKSATATPSAIPEAHINPVVATKPRDIPGMVIAGLLIAVSAAALFDTSDISILGSVFPTAIALTLIALCVLLIGINLFRPAASRGWKTGESRETSSNTRRIALVGGLACWVIAIPVIGFAVASTLGFFITGATAMYDKIRASHVLGFAAAAVAIVGGFYLLMSQVLLIRMPGGLAF